MPAKPTHIVDASALIAYFGGELGSEIFEHLLVDDRNILVIHMVNLCEVYYGYLRADGFDRAQEAFTRAVTLVGTVGDISEAFIKRVGRWKVEYSLPLGDAFAAATAEEYACPLITTDHSDFDPFDQAGAIRILWLR